MMTQITETLNWLRWIVENWLSLFWALPTVPELLTLPITIIYSYNLFRAPIKDLPNNISYVHHSFSNEMQYFKLFWKQVATGCCYLNFS